MIRTRTRCEKCSREISKSNFKKHYNSCNGVYFEGTHNPSKLLERRKYSDEELVTKRKEFAQNARNKLKESGKEIWNKGKTKETDDRIASAALKVKEGYESGRLVPAKRSHSNETKEKMRVKALASPHRRLQRKIQPYITKSGDTIMLDSSWEVLLAEKLDEHNIEWTRPSPIPWEDENGTVHNYFPDFYLPMHDLYLDPKNPYAIKAQDHKLNIVLRTYTNVIILDIKDYDDLIDRITS